MYRTHSGIPISRAKEGLTQISYSIEDLMYVLNAGKKTAKQIGKDAGAEFTVGRRRFYNAAKIQAYLNRICE